MYLRNEQKMTERCITDIDWNETKTNCTTSYDKFKDNKDNGQLLFTEQQRLQFITLFVSGQVSGGGHGDEVCRLDEDTGFNCGVMNEEGERRENEETESVILGDFLSPDSAKIFVSSLTRDLTFCV